MRSGDKASQDVQCRSRHRATRKKKLGGQSVGYRPLGGMPSETQYLEEVATPSADSAQTPYPLRQRYLRPHFDHAAGRFRRFMGCSLAFMKIRLLRQRNQNLPKPTIDASGTYVRRLLAGVCDEWKKKKPHFEERRHTLRQWRIEIENEPIPKLNSLGPVIT